jgi:hypothetical protein
VRRERQAFMVAFGVQTQASARSLLPRSERESWSDSHAWSSSDATASLELTETAVTTRKRHSWTEASRTGFDPWCPE